MAILQLFKNSGTTEQIPLDGERFVLGRHPDCDIVLDAASVSRQHAQIVRENMQFFVEDLHSRNGTFVNGRSITGRTLLEDGDRLKICDMALAFHTNQPRANRPADGSQSGSSFAVMVDEPSSGTSTIMSKLEVASQSSLRLTVNPEAKLRAMIEIAQNLGKAVSLDEVLGKLLDSLFKIFIQADRAFVILRSGPDGVLVPKAVKHRRQDLEDQVRISRTIVSQVMDTKEAVLSADATNDSRFDSSQSLMDLRIRSMMCAPLVNSDGNSLGVIQVDTMNQKHRFQKDDLDVLASIASQAAIAVDNAQLHENAVKQEGLQRDLELAHKVQRGLLPAAPPSIDGYHFFDFYEPANQVGGDYYDYIELSGHRLAVVVGDVSGKGVAAALLMAKLSGEVRYCLASEPDPASAMDRINVGFSRSGWQDRFVTFVLAVLDTARHEITIVNAGHMAPLLCRANHSVDEIGWEQAGLPLGVDSDYCYQRCTMPFANGDLLVVFTDGISEAMDASGKLYGMDRLKATLASKSDSLGRLILDDVKRFVGGRPQSDDMCLVCFGRD
jgi:phosphoserine phosphatase RsbU/P